MTFNDQIKLSIIAIKIIHFALSHLQVTSSVIRIYDMKDHRKMQNELVSACYVSLYGVDMYGVDILNTDDF